LSLVRAIIKAHGGRIEVRSTVGKGSSFVIHLPKH
jgi:signal transduction histidine kinase